MHVKSFEAQNPAVGVVCSLKKGCQSSGVVLVNWCCFMTRTSLSLILQVNAFYVFKNREISNNLVSIVVSSRRLRMAGVSTSRDVATAVSMIRAPQASWAQICVRKDRKMFSPLAKKEPPKEFRYRALSGLAMPVFIAY
ncbi:hypothetical protein TNCV_790871 [Trichonephila clavipes]|nr:hypothetical protein TNCV_790871 [Trichonephila clavipes]